jgi:hypothetical protein
MEGSKETEIAVHEANSSDRNGAVYAPAHDGELEV